MKIEVTLTVDQVKDAIAKYVAENLPGGTEYEVLALTFYQNINAGDDVQLDAICAELKKAGQA